MSGFSDLVNPSFKPIVRLISSISRGATTTIVTENAHEYITGMTVRILVPTFTDSNIGPGGAVGMPQINKMTGKITVIDSTSFSIDIDSTTFDEFVMPVTWPVRIQLHPQVVPISEEYDMTSAAVRNVLPPQVPDAPVIDIPIR